jgi:iron(III) transport system substrate-binding protein
MTSPSSLPGRLDRHRLAALLLIALAAALLAAACGSSDDPDGGSITVYSGRGEALVRPLFERFEKDTGINLRVRYADTAALAAALLEEGDRSPADVFFAQDAGALGALEAAGVFAELPEDLLQRVDAHVRSTTGAWVGVSGRARVLVYSTERVSPEELPASIFDLTQPAWRSRVAWAPTNGSFQSFVTAMRVLHGDIVTEQWLHGMLANNVHEFSNNSSQVRAVADGEIDVGLVNHYYLWRFRAEDPDIPAENLYTDAGDAGGLLNLAGVGVLAASDRREAALRFVAYMLSPTAQTYFAAAQADSGFEYPLIASVTPNVALPPLESLRTIDLDLNDLSDLEGTLDLLRKVGALP